MVAQRMLHQLERLAETGATFQRQLILLAVERDWFFAGHDLTEYLHPLPCACQRLGIRLAVPAFNYLRSRDADAEDKSAVREVVDSDGVHRGTRGRTRRDLHDGGAKLDSGCVRAHPREWGKAVHTVDLGTPQGVIAEVLGFLRELDDVLAARWAHGAYAKSELHLHTSQFSWP